MNNNGHSILLEQISKWAKKVGRATVLYCVFGLL